MGKRRGAKQIPEVLPKHEDHHLLREWRRTIQHDPCVYCGRSNEGEVRRAVEDGSVFYGQDEPFKLSMTEDHIIPRASGGLTRWWNLAPACVQCNSDKGADSMLGFMLSRLDSP